MQTTRETGQERRTAVIVAVLTVAAFVVILNETIMVNAIPQLMEVFTIDARAAQWLSTAFMLTMAVVIPSTGWIMHRLGTRSTFALAMASFCAGTLLAGLAPVYPVLLAGRVVQACGTAIMMPLLMTTVLNLVPEQHRGKVMGNVTLTISVAPALGPAVSGIILQFASWRWIFGLVLPLAALIAVTGLRLLERDEPQTPGRLDGLSVLLTVVGFGGLIYGLSQLGGEGGEGAGTAASSTQGGGVVPLIALAVGAVGLAVFVLRQLRLQRGGAPLLDLRVLRHRLYTIAVTVASLSFMGLMGVMILLPLYLQDVRGLTTLQTGLLLMPGGLVMGLLGPVVGRLYDRVGARTLVLPGAVIVLLALAGTAYAVQAAPWWCFLLLHGLLSVGLAMMFTPIFTLGLGSLPHHLYAHGSALLGTVQQVAAAAGTALVVTIMATRASTLEHRGTPEALALAGGVQWAVTTAAVLAVLVLALVLLLPRRPDAQHPGA